MNYSELIIIGGGPSGLTAAIYTSRAEIETLVFAGNPPGGQLMWTTEVENFPGFPEGVTGPELIQNMRSQAERFNTKIKNENIKSIEKYSDDTSKAKFKLVTVDGEEYFAKAVILASGASAKWLGLPNEQELIGKGVSACATCDGFFFKNKDIAVIGAGDSAMEEATFLTKFANKVHVLVRGTEDKMKASTYMKNKAFENSKIEFLFNTEVQSINGDTHLKDLTVVNNKTNESTTLSVKGLFVAIGHKPNTDIVKDLIELNPIGYAIGKGVITDVEGLFIAGDVFDFKYRQAITAAGYGCMAALEVEKFLEHN
jgi:thioredoxin reductase (NADPH)